MKFFNIKLACIFIIAMFCFAPLNAVDLNQDDSNNKYINQDDNNTEHIDQDMDDTKIDVENVSSDIGVDSTEDVDDADDSEIKTTAENDLEDSEKITDIELKDSQDQDSESRSPNIRATIENTHVGETPVVEIYSDPKFSGLVSINSPDFEHKYNQPMSGGYLKCELREYDLKEGTYIVKITAQGDSHFDKQEIRQQFKVNKYESNLKIDTLRDVFPGYKAVLSITGNNDFNGTVDVMLNSDRIPIEVVEGRGSVKLADLAPGEYKAVIDYKGDEKYTPSKSESSFTVHDKKWDPNIRLQIDDVYQGQVPVLKVSAHEKLVCYDIAASCPDFNNILKFYELDIHDGHGEVNLYQEKSLKPGNYTVTINYTGTNMFNPQVASTTFEVLKKPDLIDPELNINVDDVNVGDKVTVDLSTNEKLDGQVMVQVNGSAYDVTKNVTMKDGHGQVSFDDSLKMGNYTATAFFMGDDVFKSDTKITNFRVRGLDPNLSVAANDIYVNEKPTICIRTGFKEPTMCKVQLIKDSKIITSNQVKVSNQEIITMHEQLTKTGEYTVKVIFAGDDEYEPCESTTTFNVSKKSPDFADPDLKVHVDDITVGDKAVAKITANESINDVVSINLNTSAGNPVVKLNNGEANYTFSEDLKPGNYSVTVTYGGDSTFKPSAAFANFTVHEKPADFVDPNLSIKVNNITEGENAVAKITANESLTGDAKVYVKGTNGVYPVDIKDGVGETNITGLAPGYYKATVKFAGDDTFKAAKSSTVFKVSKKPADLVDPNLKVHVDDITQGEKVVAKITANESINDIVSLKLNTSAGNPVVKLNNGEASFTFSEDLKPGNYSVTVTYGGDSTFKPSTATANFTVHEKPAELVDPSLSIKVDDITEGENAVAVVTANESLTGDAKVSLNNSNDVYNVHIVAGSGSVTIGEDLVPGVYNATVKFAGDDTFMAGENSTVFKVSEKPAELVDPDLSIKVDDITEGENAVAVVTANESLTGDARVYVNGTNGVYPVDIRDGVGETNITGLAPGVYNATVKFAGDDTFKAAESSSVFKVSEKPAELVDPSLSIKVDDITEGENAVAVVTANESLTGDVSVALNGSDTVYPVHVKGGVGETTISGLGTGNYVVNARFDGDSIFKPSTASASFKVNKKLVPPVVLKDPNLKVSVKSVRKSVKPVITVTADKAFSGNVDVKIASKSYKVKVVNGKGTLTIPCLKVGTYTAKATLAKTNVFKASTKSTKFKVRADLVKLTLKKVKVKKSAKKLTITSTLKINGKLVKGKVLKLRFKGKLYKVKTNKKGVAKFTIKKKVLKKLKVGKKLTYKVTFSKKTVKRTVKVRK